MYRKNPIVYVLILPIVLQFAIGCGFVFVGAFDSDRASTSDGYVGGIFNATCDMRVIPKEGAYISYVSQLKSP